jgi:hypothetical protein
MCDFHSLGVVSLTEPEQTRRLSFLPATSLPLTPATLTHLVLVGIRATRNLGCTLHSLLTTFTCPITRIAKIMWDKFSGLSSRPRPPSVNKEATQLPLPPQAVPLKRNVVMADAPSLSPFITHYNKHRNIAKPDQQWEANHGPVYSNFTDTRHTFDSSSTEAFKYVGIGQLWNNAKKRQDLLRKSSWPHDIASTDGTWEPPAHIEDLEHHGPLADLPQSKFGEPFLTLASPERASMDMILAPVHDHLKKLKETTVSSLPNNHSLTEARCHPQVLKMRLSEIAECIQRFLKDVPEDRRGILEMKLW